MIYRHPQENWSYADAERIAKHSPRDSYGNRRPAGLIASNSSSSPQYGQTIKYNGLKEIDGKLYSKEHRPLPLLPAGFEFYSDPAWGVFIRKIVKT